MEGVQPQDRGSGDDAVLLVRGFASVRAAVRPVARRLAADGARVRAIRRPGHGASSGDLERTPWTPSCGVLADAARALAERSRVLAVGRSAGGGLLQRLAVPQADRLAAVAVLSPPRSLGGLARLDGLVAVSRLVRFSPRPLRNVRDPGARRAYRTCCRLALAAVGSPRERLDDLRPRAGAVRAPPLVAHGQPDRTVSHRPADRRLEAVAPPVRARLALTRSFRGATVDCGRDVAADGVARLFGRVRGS